MVRSVATVKSAGTEKHALWRALLANLMFLDPLRLIADFVIPKIFSTAYVSDVINYIDSYHIFAATINTMRIGHCASRLPCARSKSSSVGKLDDIEEHKQIYGEIYIRAPVD